MLKNLLFILPLIVLLSACQRELSPPEAPPNPPARLTGHPLKEVSFNDSSNAFTHKVNFYYDSSNRVVKMTFLTGTTNPVLSYMSVMNFVDSFYYNGADTNPWKIVSTLDTGLVFGVTKHFTSYLFYDGSGRKIKDSLIRDDLGAILEVRKHNWGSNYVTDQPLYGDTAFFSGGNINTVHRLGYPATMNFYYDQFDNKKNPYNDLNIAQAVYKRNLYPSDDFVQSLRQSFQGHFNMQSLNTNNMTSWRWVHIYPPSSGGSSLMLTYKSTYTYNPDDYPLTQDLRINFCLPPPVNIVIYQYNHIKFTYTYY